MPCGFGEGKKAAAAADPSGDPALAPLYDISKHSLQECRPHWPDPAAESTRSSGSSSGGLALADAAKDGGRALATTPSGVVRLPDGIVHVAVTVPFPGVTGAMLEWWASAFCEDTARYKLWHPVDHLWCEWLDPAYYAVPVADRPPRHYLGKRWAVRETVGGVRKHFVLHYQDPQQAYGLPGAEALEAAAGITAVLASRIYEPDAARGEMGVAHEFNCLVEKGPAGEGTELRCHFWLGDVAVARPGWLPASVVERVGNHPWGRQAFAPLSLARAVHRHCFEEMSCLAKVLPEAYRRFKDAPYVPPPLPKPTTPSSSSSV